MRIKALMVLALAVAFTACGDGGGGRVVGPTSLPEQITDLWLSPPSGSTVCLTHQTDYDGASTSAMRGRVSIWLNRAVQDPYVFFEFYGSNGQLCWSSGRHDFEGSWPGKRIYEFDYLWAPHRGAVLCPCKPAYATTHLAVRVNGPTQEGPAILERRFDVTHTWIR